MFRRNEELNLPLTIRAGDVMRRDVGRLVSGDVFSKQVQDFGRWFKGVYGGPRSNASQPQAHVADVGADVGNIDGLIEKSQTIQRFPDHPEPLEVPKAKDGVKVDAAVVVQAQTFEWTEADRVIAALFEIQAQRSPRDGRIDLRESQAFERASHRVDIVTACCPDAPICRGT